jgi:2-polyprenyl-3-methyl-5-hydroxy-6-metoxy-1,4-benzoquinol methylase
MKAPPARVVELFDRDAVNFEEYLQSPLGRLRTELIWSGLTSVFEERESEHRVLDVGGGTGAFALRLSALGHSVLLVDPAQGMLDLAKAKAKRDLSSKARENLRVRKGTITDLGLRSPTRDFSVVLCHNILEYAVGPQEILGRIHDLVREDGLVSVVVANRDAEPLRTIVHQQEPHAALQLMDKTVHPSSLFGGYRRVYTLQELVAMLDEAGFYSISVRGVRVACDYLSQHCLEQQDGWEAAYALEKELINRSPQKFLARFLHVLARPHV